MRISDWSSDVCSSDLPKNVTSIKLDHTPVSIAYDYSGKYLAAAIHEEIRSAAAPSLVPVPVLIRRQRVRGQEPRARDDAARPLAARDGRAQIGRASRRERVCPYV